MAKSKSLKTDTYPSVKELEDFKAEVKKDFLRMNKMFKDEFRDMTIDTGKEFKRLEKRIAKLEKSLEDIKSTADGAESLAGDVELDLADLTVRVDSLEAKK